MYRSFFVLTAVLASIVFLNYKFFNFIIEHISNHFLLSGISFIIFLVWYFVVSIFIKIDEKEYTYFFINNLLIKFLGTENKNEKDFNKRVILAYIKFVELYIFIILEHLLLLYYWHLYLEKTNSHHTILYSIMLGINIPVFLIMVAITLTIINILPFGKFKKHIEAVLDND